MPNFVFNVNLFCRVHLTEQEAHLLPLIEVLARDVILRRTPGSFFLQDTRDLRYIEVEPVHDTGQGTTEILEHFMRQLKK